MSFQDESNQVENMKRVLSALYTRPAFQDFRRPVSLMYPTLSKEYHSAIAEPSDLGTLLLAAIRESISVEELHR